jgi:single-strand DNA-binding protein
MVNKAIIIGRLTRDPEVRTTGNGTSVTSFSVATSFNWTNQQGQKQEQTEYHNIVAWRRLGEIVAQYLKKGSLVYVEGRLQTRSWEGQDGKKNYRTEIIANEMKMLGSKPTGGGAGSPAEPNEPSFSQDAPSPMASAGSEATPEIQIDDSDIPF